MSVALEQRTAVTIVRELLRTRPDLDADRVAEHVAAEVGLDRSQREALWSLLVRYVKHEQRARVRALEPNRIRRPKGSSGNGSKPPATGGANDLPAYMRENFSIGTGRMIPWLTATAEEHQARIDMQEQLRAGLKRDVVRHADAIAAIKACPGATCLADLPEYGGSCSG